MVEKNTVKTAGSGCAMCGKPVVEKYRPFCSKRC
ncbi:MAG TPA: DNA gyrase inhibitor YacG, partial [Thalassospira sp.]|nr:DNA gyrase inhibitor YacG [Thalassospira sp.]